MKQISIAVHGGRFHADEVFAVAILKEIFSNMSVIRTRNQDEYERCDFRIDVGGRNNPDTGDFDHHMTGGAGARPNGIPYAACGLIWRHFGDQLVSSQWQHAEIDHRLIQTIDAIDCGVKSFRDGVHIYAFSDALDSFNPQWNSANGYDAGFMRAVDFARLVLLNEIAKVRAESEAEQTVREAIAQYKDKQYLVLPMFCPWQKIVSEETSFLYVIFPEREGEGYRLRAVPVEDESFEVRKPMPQEWSGLRDNEFAAVSGVEDATFCHPALFIAGARSLNGAIRLAECALTK